MARNEVANKKYSSFKQKSKLMLFVVVFSGVASFLSSSFCPVYSRANFTPCDKIDRNILLLD